MTATFPTLRIGVLTALVELKALVDHNDGILRSKECPYDKDTVAALEKIFETRIVEKEVIVEKVVEEARGRGRPSTEVALSADDQEELLESAADLLKQLKELGEGERGLDTQTKIQIIKVKTTLMDQLLKQRERWHNVKRVSMFQATVISILDDLLDEGDRAEFLRRIEPYRE